MGSLIFMFGIAIAAAVMVLVSRTNFDRKALTAGASERGGELVRARRVRRGHPFPDSGRGWWVWQVTWRDSAGEHDAWVLTTREGIREWRD